MSEAPTRPVLRWHGGKWKLAPWIMAHLPAHRCYVEPFGGAGSVLLRKPRAYAEVYNDLDDEVVGLFRVLREPAQAARLVEQLALTPFARTEFSEAYQLTEDWRNYPEALAAIVERLRGVIIENRDAREVMAKHDGPATVHYVDPPYVADTRSPANKYDQKWRMYRHELTDEDHAELIGFLQQLDGMVVLSGYAHPIYDQQLADWRRIETKAYADGARERTEVLWLNARAVRALEAHGSALAQGRLFDGAAA